MSKSPENSSFLVKTPASAFDDPSLSRPARNALEEFIFHLTLVRAVSERTVDAYGRDLRAMLLYLGKIGKSGPTEVTASDLRHYLISLSETGKKPATVGRARSAIRTFFAFLIDEGVLRVDPSVDLDAPASWKRVPQALSVEETITLIESVVGSKLLDLRDRALLETAYGTGARVSELLGICLDDCYWEQRIVRLRGKGAKMRLVPLGEPAIAAIHAYTVEARAGLLKNRTGKIPELFLNARGGKLSRMGFWKILRKRAVSAGLGPSVHPHLLRHSYATHLLHGGASLRVVQELLGHSRLATTQIYTSVDEPFLKTMHERYHPRG